jgi:hypothetical protein
MGVAPGFVTRPHPREWEVPWCRECGRHGNKIVGHLGTDLCHWHTLSPGERKRKKQREHQG